MRETARIRQQMERAFSGGAWHGPSVMEVLEGATAATAAARPIPGAHSIWELALHLSATQQIILSRLAGERAGTEAEDFWPAAPTGAGATETAWQETLEALRRQEADLETAVDRVDDARLDAPMLEGWPSTYIHLHGYVQHSIWHAGQIALLKRAALP